MCLLFSTRTLLDQVLLIYRISEYTIITGGGKDFYFIQYRYNRDSKSSLNKTPTDVGHSTQPNCKKCPRFKIRRDANNHVASGTWALFHPVGQVEGGEADQSLLRVMTLGSTICDRNNF